MTEYFDRDGCPTDNALSLLVAGEPALDELTRLELAEHLAYCDRCVERYTALLCGDSLAIMASDDPTTRAMALSPVGGVAEGVPALLQPSHTLVEPVLRALSQRARTLFFHRYVAAGMAACLALTFWFTGVFDVIVENPKDTRYTAVYAISERFTGKAQQLGEVFSDGYQSFFAQLSSLDLKGVFQNEKK